jgi:hypothetical protein
MSQVAALKRAESYLANIAAKNAKFNIFVSQRNQTKIIDEVKKSALNTDKSMFYHYLYVKTGICLLIFCLL